MIPVKICGITRLADARSAIEVGASAIGFIFYEKSPRVISLENARVISQRLPETVTRVGVFVNSSANFIENAISSIPLGAVQLHGDEAPRFCNQFHIPVLKGIRISNKESLKQMEEYNVDGLLLDSSSIGYYGGTGQTFDWSLLNDRRTELPIILSGGLTPENVLSAIESVSPSAIDVNSGVESAPGLKDSTKMQRLVGHLTNTIDTGFCFG